jgi:uncharacterized OB-fold protein
VATAKPDPADTGSFTDAAPAGAGAAVSVPVADLDDDSLLGTFPEGRRLTGTRCSQCGQTMIGARSVCSACVSRDVARIPLPATGVLYSFTRLHVSGGHGFPGEHGVSGRHGGGAGVRPVGYVDLDDGPRTLADLREGTVPLRPDLRVELGTDGDDWFFGPAGDLDD